MNQQLWYESRRHYPPKTLPHFGIASISFVLATGALFFALVRGLNWRPAVRMLLILPAGGLFCGIMGLIHDSRKSAAWLGLICSAMALLYIAFVFVLVWSIGPLPDV